MNWLFWAFLSALFAGATAVLAKVGVEGLNSNLATAIRTTVVVLFAWILAFATCSGHRFSDIPRRSWLFLTLSGLATGLSWLCYFRGLQLGKASQVAPIDKLSVVFVVIFAAAFLREPLTARSVAGAALIVLGAILLAWT
jgi:transporter family protein